MPQRPLGTCCVVGGGGWVGSRLVCRLVDASDAEGVALPVRSLDVAPARADFPARGAAHSALDIRDAAAVRDALRGADTVFLTAAVIDVRLRPDAVSREVNVGGCRHVAAACREWGARLVYTSTLNVAGLGLCRAAEVDAAGRVPYVRRASLCPLYLAPDGGYYRTKAEGEREALAGARGGGPAAVAHRLSQVFGEGDDVVAVAGHAPVGIGPRSAHFSFVYVDNAAAAHVQAARRLADDPAAVSGRAFNIADFDANFSDMYRGIAGLPPAALRIPYPVLICLAAVAELAALAAYVLLCGARLPHVRHPKLAFGLAALDTARGHTVDAGAARRDLGYRPPHAPEEARGRAREWYATQRRRAKAD